MRQARVHGDDVLRRPRTAESADAALIDDLLSGPMDAPSEAASRAALRRVDRAKRTGELYIGKRIYADWEDAQIIEDYGHVPARVTADRIGRSAPSVRGRIVRLRMLGRLPGCDDN